MRQPYIPCEFKLIFKATSEVDIRGFELIKFCNYHNHEIQAEKAPVVEINDDEESNQNIEPNT